MRGMATARGLSEALVVAAVGVSGCTSLLGIDGHYTDGLEASGGASTADASGGRGAGGDPAAAGGAAGSGGDGASGAVPGGGGTDGSGGGPDLDAGNPDAADADAAPSSGGAPGSGGADGTGGGMPEAGADYCRPGTYTGTYTGQHRTSITGSTITVTTNGKITLVVLLPSLGGTTTANVTFARNTGDNGVDGTAAVTLHCDSGDVAGNFLGGSTVSAPPALFNSPIAGDGTDPVAGRYTSSTALSGTWSEHETVLPDLATGSGTWTATYRTFP